jgi:hypothetical protein
MTDLCALAFWRYAEISFLLLFLNTFLLLALSCPVLSCPVSSISHPNLLLASRQITSHFIFSP